MLTRRRLLAGSALSALAGMMPTSALPQVGPPPPPPVVQISVNNPAVKAAGAAVGKVIVLAGIAYIIRGMIGAMVIASLHRRYATLLEFLLWPWPAPQPGPAEEKYLRLALVLGNLPRFQEEIRFRLADGRPVQWPQTIPEMQAAIKFYSRRR